MYAIEASHTYTGLVGTVFTARLTVQNTGNGLTGSSPYYVAIQAQSLPVEVNVAIDEGLWFLHKDMTRRATDGYWGHSYYTETPADLNAFFVNGHREDGAASNPYTETVQRGMRFLFTLLTATSIGSQTYPAPIGTVNPDSNGNGLGIYSYDTYTYSGGIFMDAIVASGTPNAVTTTGGANILGRTYAAIVQDMVDGYAYGQTDAGTFMGGWGYGWNYGTSDNSVNQWAIIGMLAANGWGGTVTVPDFVSEANINSLNNTNNGSGAFAYTNSNNYFPWGPWGTTGAGMVQMVFDGITRGQTLWNNTEDYVRNNFCNTGQSYEAIRSYYYGMFSFTKAMLLYPGGSIQFLANQPGNTNPIDWYGAEASAGAACNGVARTLVNDQLSTGDWGLHNWYGYHTYFSTAWAIIMLNRTVFESGVPVASAVAIPNPGIVGQVITLDGSGSYHQDASKTITAWEWDLDNDGNFNDGASPIVSRTFGALGSYTVRLRVTDNEGTVSTPTSVIVVINTPPLAPTANAGGPYNFCVNRQPFFLDGTGSVNPDEGQHQTGAFPGDTITEYAWDLDGDGQFDDAFGAQPDVTAFFIGRGVGQYLIQLRVTDNTAASFPGSGMGNLTSVNSAQVNVIASTDPRCGCVTDLAARPKLNKAELRWTPRAGAVGYNIYRGTANGGPYLKIAEVGAVGFYLDQGPLATGVTYYWIIRERALNTDELCQSNQASARPTGR
jgi:hypothetical protein